MDLEFERELRESLFVHRPLALHRERSLEADFPNKHVTAVRGICSGPQPASPGQMALQSLRICPALSG